MGNRLTTFVKNVCANWDRDRCLGAELIYSESSDHGLFNSTGKCYIMDGNPCKYFEDCVLPSAKYDKNFIQIQKFYGKINSSINPLNPNYCNDCKVEIPKKKRYCSKCAKKRRKSTFRISSSKHRKHVNS